MLEPKKPTEIRQEQPKDERIFIVIPYRALHDKKLTIQRMRALLACCSYANHSGILFPSTDRLAADLGIAPSTMAAHIKYLTERGYLKTINNSYTVGKHAKPRAVVYDPENLPDEENQLLIAQDYQSQVQDRKSLADQQAKLIEARESSREVKAKPTSLYRCWRELVLKQFGIDQHYYDKELFSLLANRYTLEEFQNKAPVILTGRVSAPANARIMLKR